MDASTALSQKFPKRECLCKTTMTRSSTEITVDAGLSKSVVLEAQNPSSEGNVSNDNLWRSVLVCSREKGHFVRGGRAWADKPAKNV